MSMLKDCSEIQEAARLLDGLFDQNLPFMGKPRRRSVAAPAPPEAAAAQATISTVAAAVAKTPLAAHVITGEFREEKLENLLELMCQRGGFSGAVVADTAGLPLAVHNSPVDNDSLAAFTSVLGEALDKAGRFLDQHQADYISMDVNYEDKAVLRRFAVAELQLYLMVLCPQAADERSEVELTISQIGSILS